MSILEIVKKIDEIYSNGEKYFETTIKKKGEGGIMPFVIETYGAINQEAKTMDHSMTMIQMASIKIF